MAVYAAEMPTLLLSQWRRYECVAHEMLVVIAAAAKSGGQHRRQAINCLALRQACK
jgi:hypothetical protein